MCAEVQVEGTVTVDRQRRAHIMVPVDPAVWCGERCRHHVTGTINSVGVRGVLVAGASGTPTRVNDRDLAAPQVAYDR